MTIAKNQHFLPKFYLRNFVDPDTPAGQEPFLWVFDLSTHEWRRRSPKNIAALRYYYAYRDESDQLVNLLEPAFNKVETQGAILIRKLQDNVRLTLEEQVIFSSFVALLTVRTPQHRELTKRYAESSGQDVINDFIQNLVENPDKFEAARRRHEEKTGHSIDLNHLKQNPPSLKPNEAGILTYSIIPFKALTERLMGMTWRFYFTENEDKLIICDHPCDLAYPEDITEESFRGFFTEGIEFHVPLTPNLIFTAYDGGFDRASGGLLSREDVTGLNSRMAHRAEQFVVSTKPTFLGDTVLEGL